LLSPLHEEKAMIRAMYTATSGMLVESRRNDLISDNLYNGQMPGYKVQRLLKQARPATEFQIPTDVQTTTVGQFVDPSSGALRTTGKPLDFALEGKGFFVLETDRGPAYTRDGRFHRTADGVLRTGNGNVVMGENGPLKLPPDLRGDTPVKVEQDGTVWAAGKRIGRLQLADFPGYRGLQAAGGSLYYPTGAVESVPAETRVVQENVEDSNVQTVVEMSRMIESLRAFEQYQKVITTVMDDVTGEAVRRLGRVA
jgi:flagellar basal-body rod protein FlgG